MGEDGSGVGTWDGFGWNKVNLLKGIFVSLSYIALYLIVVI